MRKTFLKPFKQVAYYMGIVQPCVHTVKKNHTGFFLLKKSISILKIIKFYIDLQNLIEKRVLAQNPNKNGSLLGSWTKTGIHSQTLAQTRNLH